VCHGNIEECHHHNTPPVQLPKVFSIDNCATTLPAKDWSHQQLVNKAYAWETSVVLYIAMEEGVLILGSPFCRKK